MVTAEGGLAWPGLALGLRVQKVVRQHLAEAGNYSERRPLSTA